MIRPVLQAAGLPQPPCCKQGSGTTPLPHLSWKTDRCNLWRRGHRNFSNCLQARLGSIKIHTHLRDRWRTQWGNQRIPGPGWSVRTRLRAHDWMLDGLLLLKSHFTSTLWSIWKSPFNADRNYLAKDCVIRRTSTAQAGRSPRNVRFSLDKQVMVLKTINNTPTPVQSAQLAWSPARLEV